MLDPVPWVVDGADHAAGNARGVYHDATKGATGVILPTDMKVQTTPSPSNQVRVFPGAAALFNRYPGAIGQSYRMHNISATDVPIPATTTAPATRYLCGRVDDPDYGAQVPSDVVNGPYNRFVLLTSDPWVNLPAYPCVPLARIKQVANQSIIQASDITDWRKVANPREHTDIIPRPTLIGDAEPGKLLTATGTYGEWFPNAGGEQYFDIPWWATRMQITAEWLNVLYGPENAVGWGDMWVDYGLLADDIAAQRKEFSTARGRWDAPRGDFSRDYWKISQDVPVPAKLRGKYQVPFIMKARRDGGTITCKMDHRSGSIMTVRFMEVADLSDS